MKHTFTIDDLNACWDYSLDYLVQILNGEYSVEEAREDLYSLINSKWDRRVNSKESGDSV